MTTKLVDKQHKDTKCFEKGYIVTTFFAIFVFMGSIRRGDNMLPGEIDLWVFMARKRRIESRVVAVLCLL